MFAKLDGNGGAAPLAPRWVRLSANDYLRIGDLHAHFSIIINRTGPTHPTAGQVCSRLREQNLHIIVLVHVFAYPISGRARGPEPANFRAIRSRLFGRKVFRLTFIVDIFCSNVFAAESRREKGHA